MVVCQQKTWLVIIPQRIHVWYIYLRLPHKSTIHVGTYTNPMGGIWVRQLESPRNPWRSDVGARFSPATSCDPRRLLAWGSKCRNLPKDVWKLAMFCSKTSKMPCFFFLFCGEKFPFRKFMCLWNEPDKKTQRLLIKFQSVVFQQEVQYTRLQIWTSLEKIMTCHPPWLPIATTT